MAWSLSLAIAFAQDATRPSAEIDVTVIVSRLQSRVEAIKPAEQQKPRLTEIFAQAQAEASPLEAEIKDLQPAQQLERIEPFVRELRLQLAGVLTPRQIESLRADAVTQPAAAALAAETFVQRLKTAAGKLELNDSQKGQVSELFAQFQRQVEEIRQRRLNGANVQGEAQALYTGLRDKLLEILTPPQRQEMRQLLAEDRGDAPVAPPPGVAKADAPAPRIDAILHGPATAPSAVMAGMVAAPFKLLTPGAAFVQLSSFKGRVLVLEFGSISSPTFRDHVAAMEQLRDRYDNRAFFLIVYTAEAHPAGATNVTRNEEDGVAVDDPKDLAERRTAAERARNVLKITIPVVVDTMDGATAAAYGAFPNGTVVIGRDGKIVGHQQWTDPTGLPRLINEAIAGK